jgi:hypothetical protein
MRFRRERYLNMCDVPGATDARRAAKRVRLSGAFQAALDFELFLALCC